MYAGAGWGLRSAAGIATRFGKRAVNYRAGVVIVNLLWPA
jgi:hypothetical protein